MNISESDRISLTLKYGPDILKVRQLIIQYRESISVKSPRSTIINMAHASLLEARVHQLYPEMYVRVTGDNEFIIYRDGKIIPLEELFLD